MAGDVNINLSKDALGLSNPLTKLVETIGQGAGVVGNSIFQFDAKTIRRIGKAEAEAEKAKIISRAEAEGEALLVLGRASQRFQLEQYTKQVNLENTLAKTREILEKSNPTVSDRPVDSDWSAKFLGVAQDISDGEIQDILASIFSNELITPGTTSKQLLELLRSIDKSELNLFANYAALSSVAGLYSLGGFNNANLRPYGLSVYDIRILADIGLVTFERQLSMPIDLIAGVTQSLLYNSHAINIISETNRRIEFPIIPLSKMGEQLYVFMEPYENNSYQNKYFADLTSYLEGFGLKVEADKVIE